MFGRVKPLDAILATAEKKSLKRTLGWFQLTLFGIGCVIGTGIFVLTSVGAQKAGPGLMLAFAIAGLVCIVAALCYAEIAAMVPVAGSAYTYSYATIGEFFAWTVGWALIMEYAIAASAVSVGWSGYFSGTILGGLGIDLPAWLSAGPLAFGGAEGGLINLPALVIALAVTGLLIIGTSESAKFNAFLVAIKVSALTAFIAITLTSAAFDPDKFNPFLPAGVFGGFGTGVGAVGAAATMFFAYVGFDAVSTAAEETKNPQRNVPIGLVGSLLFCTIFYILVAAGAIGTMGGQPIMGAPGVPLEAGSPELAHASVSSEGVWESVPWHGQNAPWLEVGPRVTAELEHTLGREPRAVLVYLAFDPEGTDPALAAGDLARVVEVTENTVAVKNDTNATYFIRVVAF